MAITDVRERRPVVGSEVGVGAKVDDEKVDDKLEDLHGGQVLLPPDLCTTGSRVIVVVHDDVNAEVEHNDNPRLKKSCQNNESSGDARVTHDTGLSVKLRKA